MKQDCSVPWIETPLVRSTALSKAAGCNILLKLENLQPSGSFKCRGIGNFVLQKLARLRAQTGPSAAARAHFYISSGGNAGLACVHAAARLGCRATVVVPLSTSPAMVGRLREAGADDVIQTGASWHEADAHLTGTVMAEARRRGEQAVYVPPFDAPEIWDGNAAISREAARQVGQALKRQAAGRREEGGASGEARGEADEGARIDAIVCSVGGGGLLCGVVQGLDEQGMRRTQVIAVETDGADSLSQAAARERLVTLPAITSLCTSLGARRVCPKALECALRSTVSTVVLSDVDALDGCRRLADEERFLVEPSCGVVAAMCYDQRLAKLVKGFGEDSVVVLVVCGGSNVSLDMLQGKIQT
ncbi:hypothetical protein RJ55_02644 [Drechmeria coniospora]|nr:hypothetical protein RJ55_02644 [Drechmeria coniospora]